MIANVKGCAEVINAFGMLIVAGIVALIAYMQYKVNSERHRFELFERRISIYEDLKSFILTSFIQNDAVTQDDLKVIYRIADESEFLFGDDISQYVKDIRKQAHSFYAMNKKLKRNNLPEHEGHLLQVDIEKLTLWFDVQFENLPKKFSKYLKFEIEKKGVISKFLDIIHCKS
jgi:hypothetical protein